VWPWVALAAGWLTVSVAWAQAANPGLAAFQRFVKGGEPIEEAVVYRRISKPDGKLVNEDWLRFGFQGNSWYAQLLIPAPDNPSNLIPNPAIAICGASFTHLWVVDENVLLVDKAHAQGSRPASYQSYHLSVMQSSLALGIPIPHDGIENIRWDGLGFTTRAETEFTPEGKPTKTNTIKGTLALGLDGLPTTAEYTGADTSGRTVIHYEYGLSNQLLPTVFTVQKRILRRELIFRYEFLTLKLRRVDLSEPGGYVPRMFVDTSRLKHVMIWTNSLSYSLVNNELIPGFETRKPKQTGALILGTLAAASIAFLALWYWRWKQCRRQACSLGGSETAICRTVLATGWLMVVAGWAQETNPAVAAFQRFVNGEEPIEEAVVYRRITGTNGILVDQEWVRFGYQWNTWYAQRVEPDPANPTNMIPRGQMRIKGASFTDVWSISDKNVRIVDKAFAAGSGPGRSAIFERGFLERALSLGLRLPHDGIGNVRWDGLQFATRVPDRYTPKGVPTKTNTFQGVLTLGTNGLPATASYPGQSDTETTFYEYGAGSKLLPAVSTQVQKGPQALIVRYEFQVLKLGKVDLEKTGGYVPMLFADTNLQRVVTFWTNSLNYNLVGNQLVGGLETSKPKQTGALILGALAVAVIALLALWYWRSKRRQRGGRLSPSVVVLAAGWLMVAAGWAQETNPAVAAFQRFVNGEEPIEEAVVYRRLSKPDGKIVNEDWLRFGLQGSSWYAQRLAPDPANPTNLIPQRASGVCGASFTHLWTISDDNEDVDVVHQAVALGSGPKRFASLPLNFLQNSLALGIPTPHDGVENIHWDRLCFTTRTATEFTPAGVPTKTNSIQGTLLLGANGSPAKAEYLGVGTFMGAVVSYEYDQADRPFPAVFRVEKKALGGTIYRYEFLSLRLGKVDLEQTDGYVPRMFADTSRLKHMTIWTNSLSYSLINNKLIPGFETSKPKQTGALILGALAVAVIAFLALWYWRWREQNKQNEKQVT